jgi:isocitrate/isopropylmalate dehydrogenase
VLQGKTLTPDLGGKATTSQVGSAICEQIENA